MTKKPTDKEIKLFFKKKNLEELVIESKKQTIAQRKNYPIITNNPYAPELRDLYNLYQCIKKNKRITILEFGCGWSTLVMAIALNENRKKYESKINFRKTHRFEIFVVDNEKKFLNITKKRCNRFLKKNKINIKINYHYSECQMVDYYKRTCSIFKKLPNVNPDFIYLDGPDQFNIRGHSHGLNIGMKDFLPMSIDILLYEYFLLPGTIILSDGRVTNCSFLKNNFQRKWIFKHDKKNDQCFFKLQEPSIGESSDKQLKFYRTKD